MRPEALNREAERLSARLPSARARIGVLGSTSFWHSATAQFCDELGRRLATVDELLVITGGMPGVASAVARAIETATSQSGGSCSVVHILPFGHEAPSSGSTHYAGSSLPHRRDLLARLAGVFLLVEGGPGAAEEAAIAQSRGAFVIPIGSLGGAGAAVYGKGRPEWASPALWQELGVSSIEPAVLAASAAQLAVEALAAARAA